MSTEEDTSDMLYRGAKRDTKSGLKSERRRESMGEIKEEEEEMQEGYREITVCKITNAGIKSTINLLSISAFPPTLHLLLPMSLLPSSAANFTAVSNYSALNISPHCSTLPSSTWHASSTLVSTLFTPFLPSFSVPQWPAVAIGHQLIVKWLLERRECLRVGDACVCWGSHKYTNMQI